MSIYVGNSEPKEIYVGTTPVKEVYVGTTKVRPSIKYKTYTIVWNETEDPTQFFVRYEDDAVGLTQGSTDFDEFFGYSAVKLSANGIETAEVTQSSPGVLDITQLGTLTSGDNVMIKFPVRGIKMSKSGSQVTLSITDEPLKSGFQYYAFTRGTTLKDYLYLGAYMGSESYSRLRSWSGQYRKSDSSSTTGISCLGMDSSVTLAQAYGYGYDIETWWARQYVNALYMMKYGNPNCQGVIGQGLCNGRSSLSYGITGDTNSITNATGATNTSNSGRIKLFGLEDWRGNVSEWANGITCGTNYVIKVGTLKSNQSGKISDFTCYDVVSGTSTSDTIQGASCMTIASIVGTNLGMFIGNTSYGYFYNYYYSDPFYPNNNNSNLRVGGSYSLSDTSTGIFCVYFPQNGEFYGDNGARLMYL